jgi:hypothetical protein
MEGAHSSTVYRGLPFVGGQPLPRHICRDRTGGFVILAFPQPALG